MAYARLLAELEEGVEPPSPSEFTRVDCSNLPSMTVQSEAESCDINRIVAQFDRTGLVTHLARGIPQFADVSEVGDFQSAAQRVQEVSAWFMQLPAAIRKEFDNDPAALLDAAQDPSKTEIFVRHGLIPDDKKPAEGTPPQPA